MLQQYWPFSHCVRVAGALPNLLYRIHDTEGSRSAFVGCLRPTMQSAPFVIIAQCQRKVCPKLTSLQLCLLAHEAASG